MDVQLVVRVKLPNPAGYHSGPSGDTDYDVAYKKALREALPVGYEYIYPRLGQQWAMDSEKYSLALVRCTDEAGALCKALESLAEARAELHKLREQLRSLL